MKLASYCLADFQTETGVLQTFGYNFEIYSKVAPQNCISVNLKKKKACV